VLDCWVEVIIIIITNSYTSRQKDRQTEKEYKLTHQQ